MHRRRPTTADRREAAEILRRIIRLVPMPAMVAGYIHARADALESRGARAPTRARGR